MTVASARKAKAQPSVGDTMQAIGAAAREAARGLALASTEAKNTALREAAGALRAQTASIIEANKRDLAAAREAGRPGSYLDRLALDAKRIEGVAERPGGDRRAARPRRRGHRRVDAPQRPQDPACARAAGRGGDHLREPAQRDGRRGGALPQGRQRGDSARRLGQPSFQPRRPRLSCTRPARRPACRRGRSSSCPPPIARRWG